MTLTFDLDHENVPDNDLDRENVLDNDLERDLSLNFVHDAETV